MVFFLVVRLLQGCPRGLRECLGCQAGVGVLMTSWRLGAQSWGWAPLLDPLTSLRGVCSAWNSGQHCYCDCRQHNLLTESSTAMIVRTGKVPLSGQTTTTECMLCGLSYTLTTLPA